MYGTHARGEHLNFLLTPMRGWEGAKKREGEKKMNSCKFGVKYLDFGGTYLSFGAIYSNFGAKI